MPELFLSMSEVKREMLEVMHLTRDAGHIYFGVLMLAALLVVFGKHGARWWMLAVIAAAAVAIEGVDYFGGIAVNGMASEWAALRDVVNTLVVPAIWIGLRRRSDA